MPRDLRQIGYNCNRYPDKCYLYDSSLVQGNKLVKDAKPICRFYKRDIRAFQWERPTINGILSSRRQYTGVIETYDHVEQAKPDMFVVDQTGKLFIIVEPVITDDENKSKALGTRPAIKTTMTLRGVGK